MAPKTTKKTKTTRPSTRAVKPVQVQSAPRPGKPVVRTGTWVALIVLAAVSVAVIYLNRQSETTTEDATPTAGRTFLFTQDSLVTGIEIKPAEGDPVKVERDLEPLFPRPKWALLAHLLIAHGRARCKAQRPQCGECSLAPLCPSAEV